MSIETELWTRDFGDVGGLLPRASEWEEVDGELEFEGDGWLLSVSQPEPVEPGDVPPHVAAAADSLAFRIELGVEPSNPGPEAWAFVREVLERLGGALGGGAGTDPDTGHARSW